MSTCKSCCAHSSPESIFIASGCNPNQLCIDGGGEGRIILSWYCDLDHCNQLGLFWLGFTDWRCFSPYKGDKLFLRGFGLRRSEEIVPPPFEVGHLKGSTCCPNKFQRNSTTYGTTYCLDWRAGFHQSRIMTYSFSFCGIRPCIPLLLHFCRWESILCSFPLLLDFVFFFFFNPTSHRSHSPLVFWVLWGQTDGSSLACNIDLPLSAGTEQMSLPL